MGLSVSDAVSLLMLQVAEEHRLPFGAMLPNAATIAATEGQEAGKGRRFEPPGNLDRDLGSERVGTCAVNAISKGREMDGDSGARTWKGWPRH